MAFLELVDLTKRYGETNVVNRISLSVDKGKLICLLGPSGCGKTTTLRLIAGFATPDGGEIRVGDQLMSSRGAALAPERRRMSMIFQSYALWPHMTIFENIAYGLRLRHLKDKDIRDRVQRILDVTRLGQYARQFPGELSGGQQQRVALARALIIEPEILLLDEPLSNLDANLREEMRFEIRQLHDQYHYTSLYVTHDQSEAMTTADEIVVMNGGNIEQQGSPEDIYENPQSQFVAKFIGGSNLFSGQWDRQKSVDCGNGLVLRCSTGNFAESADTAVSIRHYDTLISPASQAALAANQCRGTIIRHSYLGQYRDYLVKLPTGQTLRAMTPADTALENGRMVDVHLPAEKCHAMTR